MAGLFSRGHWRAAIGLVAAYTIALQTLFAAFAPLPANAQGADLAGWHVLCFGSGNAVTADYGDPDAPAPASGKFHCVLCGSALAAAAVLPEPVAAPAPNYSVSVAAFASAPSGALAQHVTRAGHARAPPFSV
jgi:hypothetical protein